MPCSGLTLKSNSWFFSDCVTGSRQQARKGLKCRREVFPLWIWGLWKALHHCPPSQGKCGSLAIVYATCSTQMWIFLDNISFTASSYDVVTCFSFSKPLLHCFVCATFRSTSAHTLETNHTSVTILAVGKSLQQVTVENFSHTAD